MKKCANNTRTKEVKPVKQRGKDLFCVLCFLDLFPPEMFHALKACGYWIIKNRAIVKLSLYLRFAYLSLPPPRQTGGEGGFRHVSPSK